MPELTSTATFEIVDSVDAEVTEDFVTLPTLPVQSGFGRLVHPTLGAYDYSVKPDEWVNIDADILVPPTWASTKTLGGAVNVLWRGFDRDVIVEERWTGEDGLSMPVGMMRMLYSFWQNPVDPATGYVEWYPNYISPLGFKVLMIGLSAGQRGITFDDVVNYDTGAGLEGWMTNEVSLTMKIAGRVGA